MENNNHNPLSSMADQLTAYMLVFGFLHKVFYEPPAQAFVAAMVNDALFADWPIETSDKNTQTGLALLQTFTTNWQDDQLAELKRDFARLFVGPDRLLAPPWESVYLSREHLLFEAQTMAVRSFYGRFNLRAPHLNNEPDDHIGLEFAFLAHLCRLGLMAVSQNDTDALAEALQAQRDFLDEHLLRWAPQFCQKVITQAETPFFHGVAYLALGSLQDIAQMLEITISEAGA
jgi:TorA maturation chaperone TorD